TGGVSLFLLCREYGLSVVPSLVGALAFQLGEPSLHLTTWLPTANLGAYVWMPTAMLMVERTLGRPGFGGGVKLGIVVTLSMLAGNPQITMFIYQLLAMGILWEVATAWSSLGARTLGAIGLGLALPLGLSAVQLLPSLELAGLSGRPRGGTAKGIDPG